MYDKVPFNKQTHLMELADVGLMSLFIMDCQSLAEIALLLERKEEARELKKREALFTKSLQSLWDEEQGIFLNRRTDTGEKSKVLSPTSFYPLLARVASPAQAKRMIKEHYFNPQEFYGEWVIPSTPRNNPTFESQDYWRGRIWGPMNYLVYLGLRNYDLPDARKDLVSKSNVLLLKTWRNKRLVHENYHGITGNGLNAEEKINRSDSFYHWGALLGLIPLLDAGFGEVKTK
jgi:neutral trehalase